MQILTIKNNVSYASLCIHCVRNNRHVANVNYTAIHGDFYYRVAIYSYINDTSAGARMMADYYGGCLLHVTSGGSTFLY